MQTPLTSPAAIRAAANHEANVERISEGRVRVIPGQVWLGSGGGPNKLATREEQKLTYGCNVNSEHPDWEARPQHILRGSGCPACMAVASGIEAKARQDAITASFVGQTTADGHVILEHSGYHQAPRDKKLGRIGRAKFRYRCGNCGKIGEALGNDLKTPGSTPGCSHCHKKRETINTLLRQPKRANSLAMFYVVPVWYDQFIKIGITKNFKQRSASHEVVYDGAYFVSHLMPRAWVYVAEQIILKETLQWQPETPLPKEMIETYWPGTSELRDWQLDPDEIIDRFHQIIDEIKSKDGDWYTVYKANFTKGGQS